MFGFGAAAATGIELNQRAAPKKPKQLFAKIRLAPVASKKASAIFLQKNRTFFLYLQSISY